MTEPLTEIERTIIEARSRVIPRSADFDARFPNWDRDTKAYCEAMAKLSPEQKRHAGCDHAYGICSG